jgi:polyphosphate glucokinase
VHETIARLVAALEPEYVVLGGGNAAEIGELPPSCRLGHNEDAFLGGFRLWLDDGAKETSGARSVRRAKR